MFLPKRTKEEIWVARLLLAIGFICFAIGLSSCATTNERRCDEPCHWNETPLMNPNSGKCWCEPKPRPPREHFREPREIRCIRKK